MTYYIVGSDEERAAVEEQALWRVEDNAVHSPNKHWKFAVLMAGTMESETAALATLGEVKARWTAAKASGLEVVDLRSPELRHSLALQRIPVFIYLVESQERADYILASIEGDRNESESPRPTFFAFKATTSEEEASVAEFVESLAGRDVRVIDGRTFAPIE